MARAALVWITAGVLAHTSHAEPATAYSALKAAQKSIEGSPELIEMMGERGEPRPQEWKILLSDPSARGGVREVTASGEGILSQRTPVRGYTGIASEPAVSLSRLNLDSDAAFQIANRQAVSKRLGFNWVDYTLRANNATGSPMWVLRLYDHMGSQVGVIQISAESGSVIMPLDVTSRPRPNEPEDPVAASPPVREVGGFLGRVGGALQNAGVKVKDTTLRTAGNVQEFLTGDRTIGPQDEEN